jgi:hypothetical protein
MAFVASLMNCPEYGISTVIFTVIVAQLHRTCLLIEMRTTSKNRIIS